MKKKNPPKKSPKKQSKKEGEFIIGDVEQFVYKLILYEERPMSVNTLWSGLHWKVRSSYKNKVLNTVTEVLDGLELEKLPFKVNIDFVCWMKGVHPYKIYDSDNLVIKPYVDSLRKFILKDDTIEYVGKVSVEAKREDVNPRLEITIQKAEE